MNNETEVSIKFKNTITNENKLKEYAKTLQKIHSVLSSIEQGKIKQMEDSSKEMGNVSKEAERMAKRTNTAFDYRTLRLFAGSLSRVYSGLIKVTQKSSEFLESFNLFQVAFNGSYTEAEKFINKMSEMYGLDEAWLTKTTSLFKQLANAMGMGAETGEKLSKLLTQMSVDISSLYNLDVDKVPQILQSALAGQTKPARRLGADITQATLQTTLGNLGIDQSVANLSYAEKRLLIVISLTQQLTRATNDWGRTLESPANQMRILSEQFNRLTREVGNVFLPILAKILPYLNAILMVLTEIIAIIARLFGYRKEDYDFFEEMADDIYDFSDGVGEAASGVEKLKRGLRGFDKLNNITTPSASSTSVGGGAGGIDPRLMKAFNTAYDEYFKKISKVEMKATKIRDRIMEWLGFEKKIDEETDDVYFKFKKITGGTVLGALIAGGTIFNGIRIIYRMLKSIGLLKLPIISQIFGLGKSAKAMEGVGDVAGAVAKNEKAFTLPSFKTILKGIGEIALIIAACTAIVAAYGALSKIPGFNQFMQEGVNSLILVFKGMGSIALPLAAISALMAGLGLLSELIYPGIVAMAAVIGASTLIIAAFGGLAKISGINEFLNGGIELLCLLFEGIGKIAGVLVGGFIEGVNAGIQKTLENFGTSLSTFIVNATPFLDSVSKYGVDTFEAMKMLASALLSITSANLLESLTGWLTGKGSLEKFGEELGEFAPHFNKFAKNISGVNKDTTTKTKIVAEAMEDIIEFTKKIPNSGGAAGFFAGENDLDIFAKQLPSFGKDFATYSSNVSKADKNVVENSKNVKDAMDHIISFAKKIPNEGGVAAFFAGDNGIKEFGKNLASFGKDYQNYSKSVNGIDVNKMNSVSDTIGKIVDYFKKIKDNKLVSTIKDFSKELKDSANNIKTFFNNAFSSSTASDIGWNFGKNLANSVSKGFKSQKLPTLSITNNKGGSLGEYTIKAYASGGLPPVGQLFMANEKGPELVGQVGGQSFVANQNQVLDLLDKKIGSANKGTQVYNIYLDQDHKLGTYTLEQLQQMAKSNGKPLNIY